MTRRLAGLALFNLAGLAVVAALVGLSAWQLQRREWKIALIERVAARAHGPPSPAPGPERWPAISAASDEYRSVAIHGRWLAVEPALARASTVLGAGYWVMAPFARDDGTTILVNRGFVPMRRRDPSAWRAPPAGPATVTGLLRISEPGGSLLQRNDPASDRWRSRDVGEIARARGLGAVAPYFIDMERAPGDDGPPIAGLTVLAFANNHLVYALTWAALALMAAGAVAMVDREAWRAGGGGLTRRSRRAQRRTG